MNTTKKLAKFWDWTFTGLAVWTLALIANLSGTAVAGFIIMIFCSLGVIFYSIKLLCKKIKESKPDADAASDVTAGNPVSSLFYIIVLIASMIMVNIKYVPDIVAACNSIIS